LFGGETAVNDKDDDDDDVDLFGSDEDVSETLVYHSTL
jgi:hypothetical protein